MMFHTHLAFGIFVALFMRGFFVISPYLYYPIVIFGALLPDLDKSNSYMGKKAGVISSFIESVFGHRGLLHGMLFGALLGLLLWLALGRGYGLALMLGYFSHLLIDGFTKEGVNFLYPIGELRLHGFVKSGDILENLILLGLIVLIVLKIF